MGLQTWNSLRSLDWIASLPDVDTNRIGVTGASGGGTQTFLLGVIDDRPSALFPAVMVSTAMQGGCTCENASYLRVGTGNIELAAVIAPRPLSMSAANDWTKELETKGLPELKRLYALMGAADRVDGRHFDFGHNYNFVSRRMMYEFFKQNFDLKGDVEERDFKPLTQEELTVWNAEHPKPAMDEAAEVALLQALDARDQQQLAALAPKDAASLDEFRKVVGGAYDVMIGRTAETIGKTEITSPKMGQTKNYSLHMARIRNTSSQRGIAGGRRLSEGRGSRRSRSGRTSMASPPCSTTPANRSKPSASSSMRAMPSRPPTCSAKASSLPDGKPLAQSPVVKNPASSRDTRSATTIRSSRSAYTTS